MEYRNIGGKQVSRVIFGTTNIDTCDEKTEKLLDDIVGLEVNALDAARVYGYGKTEGVLGWWMEKKKNRDEIVIITKGAHPEFVGMVSRMTRDNIIYDMNTSLEQLRTDYTDIYLLHRDDTNVPVGIIMEAMQELVEAKKTKVIGVSNWTIERIKEANKYAKEHGLTEFTVSSPNYGIAEQLTDLWGGGCVTISGPQNKANRKWYEDNQMPIMSYSSLARGMFSGKVKSDDPGTIKKYLDDISIGAYAGADNIKRLARCEELAKAKGVTVAQIAMSFIFSQKLNTFAIVSTSSIERMKENIRALDIVLSEEEIAYLDLEK